MNLEAIFIAANVREATMIEEILEEEGIEFEMRPEAFTKAIGTGACFEGLMYEVLVGQADYCRKLLTSRGFTAGLIDATP